MFSHDEREELLKQIEEAKQREEAALNGSHEEPAENKPEEEEKETETAESDPEVKEEPKTEDKPAQPEKKPEEEKLDDSGYARLRREAAAAKKEKERLELELAELRAGKTEEKESQGNESEAEIAAMLEERQFSKAEREFIRLEQKTKDRLPDYENITREFQLGIAQSIRIHNPKLTLDELEDATKRTLLAKAGRYLAEGFDPVEELYHEAKELGFTGKSLVKEEDAKPQEEKKEAPRPDMDKVAANRARNAGTGAPAGGGKPQLTREYAANMKIDEWQKLSIDEKRRVMEMR